MVIMGMSMETMGTMDQKLTVRKLLLKTDLKVICRKTHGTQNLRNKRMHQRRKVLK
jgi:hypothetical protein